MSARELLRFSLSLKCLDAVCQNVVVVVVAEEMRVKARNITYVLDMKTCAASFFKKKFDGTIK